MFDDQHMCDYVHNVSMHDYVNKCDLPCLSTFMKLDFDHYIGKIDMVSSEDETLFKGGKDVTSRNSSN